MPPYRARANGKGEGFNRYRRNNFWVPLRSRFATSGLLVDADTANREARIWLREVVDVRVHGDLKERPVERWQLERAHLLPNRGVVNLAPRPMRRVPVPIASLQHTLYTDDAPVIER